VLGATGLLLACAHHPVTYSALGPAIDGQRVSVAGHLLVQRGVWDLAILCAEPRVGWNDGSCINLVRRSGTPVNPPRDAVDSCVVVRGRFLAFGPDRIGMGNLDSDVGMIEVDRIVPCKRTQR
jgi:hypothetical protein